MTQEQKAKRYDEAIKVAKSNYETIMQIDNDCTFAKEGIVNTFHHIFPELAESEDERISREITEFLVDFNNGEYERPNENTIDSWLSWLEKQSKSIYNVPSREVILAIWELGNGWKELTNGSISTEHGTQLDYIQKHWHESEYYLKEKQGAQPKKHDVCDNCDQQGGCVSPCPMKPAEWTAEDEKQRINTIGLVKNANDCAGILDKETALNWLNDIKDRFVPQSKQEWSEEDDKIIEEIINDIECARAINYHAPKEGYEFRENWLKSLNPQNRWKPSDEQMDALEAAVSSLQSTALESLYNDLKKLREE